MVPNEDQKTVEESSRPGANGFAESEVEPGAAQANIAEGVRGKVARPEGHGGGGYRCPFAYLFDQLKKADRTFAIQTTLINRGAFLAAVELAKRTQKDPPVVKLLADVEVFEKHIRLMHRHLQEAAKPGCPDCKRFL